MNKKLISIIIPCYRSALTLPNVITEIRGEFEKQDKYDYQIILANDGSPDNTFEVIEKICESDNRIIGLNLSRNFGQASAKMSALGYADGEITVFMDDDGQHPASGIFPIAEKVEEGFDLVYAHFPHKKHSLFKKFTSALAGRIGVAIGSSVKGIHKSSFIGWSRFSLESLRKYHSPFPASGSYLLNLTKKVANVEVEHRPRLEGKSNYTLKKMVTLWLNFLTSFSVVPLRIASFSGAICALAGFLFGAFTIIRKIIVPQISAGYTSTIAIVLFIGGMIMMMLGLIGEYIGRIYMTVSDLPQYKIRDVVNSNKKEAE